VNRTLLSALLGLLLASTLLSEPAAAGQRGTLRFGGSVLEASASIDGFRETAYCVGVFTCLDIDNNWELEVAKTEGPFVGVEVGLNEWLGLELSAVQATFDLDLILDRHIITRIHPDNVVIGETRDIEVRSAELDATFLTLGANFHLTPGRRVDLYLGPLVGYALYDEEVPFSHIVFPESAAVEDEWVYGAVLGLDVPLGDSRWMLGMAVRGLRVPVQLDRVPAVYRFKFNELEESDADALDLDPVEFRVGLGWRFGRWGG
jgi:hypothetical protein